MPLPLLYYKRNKVSNVQSYSKLILNALLRYKRKGTFHRISLNQLFLLFLASHTVATRGAGCMQDAFLTGDTRLKGELLNHCANFGKVFRDDSPHGH